LALVNSEMISGESFN